MVINTKEVAMVVNREVTKQKTDEGEVLNEKTTTNQTNATTTQKGVFKAQYIVYYVLGLVEIVLALRLILKLLGANPASGFVSLVYSVTGVFIAPFAAIFPVATTEGVSATAVLEPATIIAMIVYALVAWGISALIGIITASKDI